MKTEQFETAADFMLALTGKKPRSTRGRNTRPDLPAAGRSASTGLTTLIAPKAGSGKPAWSLAFDARGYKLYVINSPALDTGWCATELAACDRAKELGRS